VSAHKASAVQLSSEHKRELKDLVRARLQRQFRRTCGKLETRLMTIQQSRRRPVLERHRDPPPSTHHLISLDVPRMLHDTTESQTKSRHFPIYRLGC
jgi:hypothetical protein